MHAWYNFQSVANEVKMFALNSQKNYERCIGSQVNSSPKLFHSYLKHRKTDKPTVGPIRLNDGRLTDDPKLMADSFAESFSSVFAAAAPTNDVPHQACHEVSNCLTTSPLDVSTILSNLDPNSSMGVDHMHPRLLKNLANDLCVPLSIIFNSSLSSGVLPDEWLISYLLTWKHMASVERLLFTLNK